ncbi:MAG: hypothetical protein IKK50_09615 [Ruminiclostridium sp.]|nr:hypothetical protein [Ruminiclostridium sp.]
MKQKRRRPQGKPKGANYADVLAYQKAKEKAIEKAASDTLTQIHADMQTQRMMWLMVCAMADAFEIGPRRARKFFECLQANSEEIERMRDEVDDDYAWEKLRLRAQQVTGIDIKYVYEENRFVGLLPETKGKEK